MTLVDIVDAGDASALPSRRDETWRWTDLRGLVRDLPPRSTRSNGAAGPGPFGTSGSEVRVENGGVANVAVAPDAARTVRLRLISGAGAGSHSSRVHIEVECGGRLTLLESYEGASDDYVAATDLSIQIGPGAR
ncbi:MAG: Fe-S cluster assembly protein SufD, partial [Caulobacteraceae bacterium]|nr:Fe-S cluster assembly protein SufD [Caulobacteraceae bacterium]